MELKLKWKEELSFNGTDENQHQVVISNDVDDQGNRRGFSPLQLLALGLGACSSMDIVSIMQKKRQVIEDFEIKVSYERVDEHPRVWKSAHVEYIVTGKKIDPEALERSIELSIGNYCSAHAMLSKAVEITSSYKIIES